LALSFYLGPFKIAATRLRVVSESCLVDPRAPVNMRAPRLADLPSAAVGLYRRSEIVNSDLPTFSRSEDLLRYVEKSYQRRFIDLSGDFEGYLRKFSSKTRSTLKRKIRKFGEFSGGKVDWRQYRSPTEIADFHALARSISAGSYQERLFDAGLPEDPEFLAHAQALARENRVRAYLLFHHGRAVSYLFCPITDGRLEYQYLGFLPEFAQHSPGTVLQYLALEEIFAERAFRLFDFTEGDGEHKQFFSTASVHCANVLYLKPLLWVRALLWSHRALSAISTSLDRIIAGIGLKARLRQLFRGIRPRQVK